MKALHLGFITVLFFTLLAASAENRQNTTRKSAAVESSLLRPVIFLKTPAMTKKSKVFKVSNL